MPRIEKFEDLIAWQKSRLFVKEIYKSFSNVRDYSFSDQIQRAVLSVINNIAEGFGRKGSKEFAKFIFIAKGSCAEVRSMLYVALDLNYINQAQFDRLINDSDEIARILQGLINTLRP